MALEPVSGGFVHVITGLVRKVVASGPVTTGGCTTENVVTRLVLEYALV